MEADKSHKSQRCGSHNKGTFPTSKMDNLVWHVCHYSTSVCLKLFNFTRYFKGKRQTWKFKQLFLKKRQLLETICVFPSTSIPSKMDALLKESMYSRRNKLASLWTNFSRTELPPLETYSSSFKGNGHTWYIFHQFFFKGRHLL